MKDFKFWTEEEDKVLIETFDKNVPLDNMLNTLRKKLIGRTDWAIKGRINTLNLDVDYDEFIKYTNRFIDKHGIKYNSELSNMLLAENPNCHASESTISHLLGKYRKSDRNVKLKTMREIVTVMKSINAKANRLRKTTRSVVKPITVTSEVKPVLVKTVIKKSKKSIKGDNNQIKLEFNNAPTTPIDNSVKEIAAIATHMDEVDELKEMIRFLNSEIEVQGEIIKNLKEQDEATASTNQKILSFSGKISNLVKENEDMKEIINNNQAELTLKDRTLSILRLDNSELTAKVVELENKLKVKTTKTKRQPKTETAFVNDGLVKTTTELDKPKDEVKAENKSFLERLFNK